MADLSIVVPAYNEEDHIETLASALLGTRERILKETRLKEVEIIIVDDGSRDSTAKKLKEANRKSNGNIQIVSHDVNLGYGAALKTGFRASSGALLSFMDADGTIHPDSLIPMHDMLVSSRADMVVGTRFGAHGSQMPMIRKIGNRFFAGLLTVLSGKRVRDSASGIRLFRREIISQLEPLPDGLHFTPAMSTKALHEQLKIVEVPIDYAERSGESKLKVTSDGLRFLRIIVQTVLLYNPFKVFLFVGLLSQAFAAALFSVPIYSLLAGEDLRFSDYIYRSIGGMYFFTIGVQIILFGILARFIVSTFFKRYESGQFIHRLNHAFKVYDRIGIYGLGVLMVGGFINGLYFWKYFFAGGLELHWAWLLIAAAFIIVGVQMGITGIVIRILKDIKAARDLTA